MATPLGLNDETTTFMDMNDDCILEILSIKYLSAFDLCSVADTCRRLKEIVGQVFRREKVCDIRSLSYANTARAKRILMHFGSHIRHLKVNGATGQSDMWPNQKVLEFVTEYCVTNLQSLELENIIIFSISAATLRPLFKNLQKFKIEDCTFEGSLCTDLLADCGSLIELDMGYCRNAAPFILVHTFPRLEQFESNCRLDPALLESFISRHMNLKSLQTGPIASSVLQRIAACTGLETFRCDIQRDSAVDLSNLGHLRELRIACEARNVMTTALGLDNLQLLEHLTLRVARIDIEFVRTLSQLTRLQVLKLEHCTEVHNLHRIGHLGQLTTLEIQSLEHVTLNMGLLVKRLSKLTAFSFRVPRLEMDLETYLQIVDVVRRRPDKSKLTFRLRSYSFNDHHLRADFARNAHLVKMIISLYG